MRWLPCLALVLGCSSVTAYEAPVLRFEACPVASVWQITLDGAGGIWLFEANGHLDWSTSRGRHLIVAERLDVSQVQRDIVAVGLPSVSYQLVCQ